MMTQAVIHRLETVKIDEQHTQPVRFAGGNPNRMIDPVHQKRAIGQIGQRVMVGEMSNSRILAPQFGRVGKYGHIAGRLAALGRNEIDGGTLQIRFATFAPVPDFATPATFAAQRLPELLVKRWFIMLRAQQTGHMADRFPGTVASDFGKSRVHRQNAAVHRGNHHAFQRVFKDTGGQPQFAGTRFHQLLQLLLGVPVFGQIRNYDANKIMLAGIQMRQRKLHRPASIQRNVTAIRPRFGQKRGNLLPVRFDHARKQ